MVYTRKYRESILNDCNAGANYRGAFKLLGAKYTDPTLGSSFIRISEDLGGTWGETIRYPYPLP